MFFWCVLHPPVLGGVCREPHARLALVPGHNSHLVLALHVVVSTESRWNKRETLQRGHIEVSASWEHAKISAPTPLDREGT